MALRRMLDETVATLATLASEVLPQGNAVPYLPVSEERLPFTIRVARSDEQLEKAVAIRHAAYARHLPTLAASLKWPEENDRHEGSVVLLAESKLDGSPLGTLRIQTNRCRRLALEQSVELPGWLQDMSLAEITRLAIPGNRQARVVKAMLFKAMFQYCDDAGIDWLVIGARSPLDREYAALLFKDVFPEVGFIPLSHGGNIAHRILAFEMESAQSRWLEANHPLYNLVFNTRHPDIQLHDDGSVFKHRARRPRQAASQPAAGH